MTASLEAANASLRTAIEARREAQAAGKPYDKWYKPVTENPNDIAAEVLYGLDETPCVPRGPSAAEVIARFSPPVHPVSQAFYNLCDEVKEMHRRKSGDYGCPSGTDPLANIRNGAKFVGIEPWRAAMVRLSDKVTRIATFNATGSLTFESVEDSLLDLASYALLSLVLYRESRASSDSTASFACSTTCAPASTSGVSSRS